MRRDPYWRCLQKRYNMCRYQELAMSENGYIIRCPECRHYQVCFEGIVLSFSEKEFRQLLREIRECGLPDLDVPPQTKTTIVATPKQGVHLWLSASQLLLLQQMAESADCEIKALDLLALFQ
jgi:hypothetical protein